MKAVHKLLIFLSLLFVASFMTGCAGFKDTPGGMKITSTVMKCPDGTPEGERCVVYAKTPFDWSGSKKFVVAYTAYAGDGNCTYTDKKTGRVKVAKCGTDIIGMFSETDRLATLTTPLINAGAQLGSAAIRGHYQVKAAKADNSGDTWILAPSATSQQSAGVGVNIDSSSNSLQYQVQGQETGVGVGVSVSDTDGCSSGNCYDPRQ